MAEDTESVGVPISPEGLTALEAEIEELEGIARTEMAARIKTARELGDLKENADYHLAKDDQAHLEAKIRRLRHRLRTAVVTEVGDEKGAQTFAFGRTAEIHDEDADKTHTWTLVGSTEADMAQGRLSVESPVGRALRDRALGEKVTIDAPRGARTYSVRRLLG